MILDRLSHGAVEQFKAFGREIVLQREDRRTGLKLGSGVAQVTKMCSEHVVEVLQQLSSAA